MAAELARQVCSPSCDAVAVVGELVRRGAAGFKVYVMGVKRWPVVIGLVVPQAWLADQMRRVRRTLYRPAAPLDISRPEVPR